MRACSSRPPLPNAAGKLLFNAATLCWARSLGLTCTRALLSALAFKLRGSPKKDQACRLYGHNC